jgi:uncharacterized protein with PhoU and TrkA domain
MSRIPNLTFSREKDREVLYLEAKIDSIKRRLSKSAVSVSRKTTASESTVSPTYSILWQSPNIVGAIETSRHYGKK